ncbi:MAG: helix-turn-helix domain-containing protein [Haloarculaceae archaeon]
MVTIIAEVRVPAGHLPLGRILQEYPDIDVELERLVPTHEAIIPLFWVDSDAEQAVEATLKGDPLVQELDRLTRTPDRILYSVTWSPDIDTLVRALLDTNADVLSANGRADAWDFLLQFRSRMDFDRFRRMCVERDIDIQLLDLYNPLMPPKKGPLTSAQHDVLATAFENGYWDVPRRMSQSELADLIGLSDAVLSRQLRAGVKIANHRLLFGPDGSPHQ